LEPGQLSKYNDWAVGWATEFQFLAGAEKLNFVFTTASRQALGPTHPSVHWVLGSFPMGEAVRA